MKGTQRHYFPGNNTPEGFFSYCSYILDQKEAKRIYCIKGGPGSGKSTFMRKIGEEFLDRGMNVDFLHCSSDSNSLDGIIIKNKRTAFIDATRPHVTDPINPGAVDEIINLGAMWKNSDLTAAKRDIIRLNSEIGRCFARAYNMLAAASNVHQIMEREYERCINDAEIYKTVAEILDSEFEFSSLSLTCGSRKKFFASAITPEGNINYIKSLVKDYKRIYLINAPTGLNASTMFNILSEGAVYRGIDVEEFYCPMKPAEKIEHLLFPEERVAFITCNNYHDTEPWELDAGEIMLLDLSDMVSCEKIETDMVRNEEQFRSLLEQGIEHIREAHKKHDELEAFYIPAMDFEKIDAVAADIIEKTGKNDIIE